MYPITFSSFKINEYLIPEFSIEKGKMLRFWIEVVPRNNNNTDGYHVSELIQKHINIQCEQNKNLKIHNCKNRVKLGFFDFLKPISVGEYLKIRLGLDDIQIAHALSFFRIKPNYTVSKMGFKDQKLFSIISGVEKSDAATFDFFGFGPKSEEELTNYFLARLQNGKVLIALDNLYFKTQDSENSLIEDIIVTRV